MLLRGFTAVRDAGGPIFPLKRAIDAGKTPGPRIWPSSAIISQTSGHGDYRTPEERSRRFTGKPSRAEQYDAAVIADGRDEVLTATCENLRQGARMIKLMASGGTSSSYDPLDVTQYTLDEMKAAVDAARRLEYLRHRPRLHAESRASRHRCRRQVRRAWAAPRRTHDPADGEARHLAEQPGLDR
jgi:imidazolonepropionase-like amidohydrolase